MPADVFETLRERCFYDADDDKWTIVKPGDTSTQHKHNGDPNMPLLVLNDNRQMTDSGLGAASSSDVSSTNGDLSAITSKNRLFMERPVR